MRAYYILACCHAVSCTVPFTKSSATPSVMEDLVSKKATKRRSSSSSTRKTKLKDTSETVASECSDVKVKRRIRPTPVAKKNIDSRGSIKNRNLAILEAMEAMVSYREQQMLFNSQLRDELHGLMMLKSTAVEEIPLTQQQQQQQQTLPPSPAAMNYYVHLNKDEEQDVVTSVDVLTTTDHRSTR